MIEDAYEPIGSRHVRLPASLASDSGQLKCDLMHLVKVVRDEFHVGTFFFSFFECLDEFFERTKFISVRFR